MRINLTNSWNIWTFYKLNVLQNFMNTADRMRDFCQYYRCFLQILMIERTHWLGLLRLLWQILWDNSSLSTLLFIQNCKRYLSNETCVYWCNDFKYQIKHKITRPFDRIKTEYHCDAITNLSDEWCTILSNLPDKTIQS